MTDKKTPLVSVIIPCYNTERYVESAVRSIMNQTYKNLEILCCDDCSTDGTFLILQRLSAEDTRITLFKNETNLKIVKTLNSLVAAANGTYIARMDADDISLPERIEKQVAFMESNPDYALCGTNAWHIDENGRKIGKSALPLSFEDCEFFLPFYSVFYHPTVMVRAEICKSNPYDENFLYAEDYELWCRLFFEKKCKGANLKKRLFEYRIFKIQSSEKHRKEQNESSARIFDTYKIVLEEFVDFHKNIFFTHNNIPSGEELLYAQKCLHKLLKKRLCLSFATIHTLLLHIKKVYPKKIFVRFVLNSKCFLVLVKKWRSWI